MGAAEGPQWARLLSAVEGDLPPKAEMEAFVAAGCRVQGEAKSHNLRTINLATGAYYAAACPELRVGYQRTAEDYFADEDEAWCADEIGSTTYQMHTVSATELWLDAADGAMRWLQPYLELALSRHWLWCKLHSNLGRPIVSCGTRCGSDTDPSRDDWWNCAKMPQVATWRRWVKYQWRQSKLPFRRFPDDRAPLRIRGTVTVERYYTGHVSTLSPMKLGHSHPPAIWSVAFDYTTGKISTVRSPGEKAKLDDDNLRSEVVIDHDGVHD